MLHEILFALLGKTGNIIIESDNRFEINPLISFLSSSEKELINKLIIIGFHYRKIEKFLQETYESFCQNTSFISKKLQEDDQNEFIFGKSLYIKAFIFALDEVLNEYRDAVLNIEREFLKNRVFTLSLLNIHLSKYFVLMPETNILVERIMKENLKGGQIIDLLYERNNNGNEYLREIYTIVIRNCYKILFSQLSSWILYGKISDLFGEFFIYKVEKKYKNIDESITEKNSKESMIKTQYLEEKTKKNSYNWDSSFSIKFSMIPQAIISIKLAEKILFIGKANKILQTTKKLENKEISSLPDQKIIKILNEIEEYDPFKFNNVIEKLRFEIGAELLDLLIKKEDFLHHLTNLKQFYFLDQGLFFQIFYEESKQMMQLPPKPSSENDINSIALQNTILRLNLEDNKTIKKLSFKIKANGFEFNNFSSSTNLKILGEVKQRNNAYIRFEPMKTSLQSGVVWYTLKQNLENGFKLSFCFRFKKSSLQNPQTVKIPSQNSQPNYSNSTQVENLKNSQDFSSELSQNIFCFIIHNSKELYDFKKSIPKNLTELPEYIAIKFGLNEKNQRKNDILDEKSRSFLQIVYFSKEKEAKFPNKEMGDNNKEKVLFEHFFDSERLNFSEEDIHSVKINYDNENLEVIFSDSGLQNNNNGPNTIEIENEQKSNNFTIKIPVKISKLLNLEMGKGYVGFLQDSKYGTYGVDFLNWKMLGSNILNNEDSWNGLSISYQVEWPLSLILSSQVLEKYTNIFRYMFPIRLVQLDLQKIWLNLMKKNKALVLEKRMKMMVLLRNQMSLVIENLWSYFHLDVLEVQWTKLKENFGQIADFDEMRKFLDDYLNSISNQLFLHFPKIVKSIFEIINNSKGFINLLMRLEYGGSFESLLKDCEQIKIKFEENFLKLLNLLALLNKNYNSPFLFQLLVRLDYNNFYLDNQNLGFS